MHQFPKIETIATKPFSDQHPGTSGLRKKARFSSSRDYLDNFVQSIFDGLEGFEGNAGAGRRWALLQP